MKNKIGLFAGSFDPPTNGHVDLIQRASLLCHQLYVGIATNSRKKSNFTLKEKETMIAASCRDIPHLKIVEIPGLVAEYAKTHQIDFLIRGIRSPADFEFESQLAIANKQLTGLETILLVADPKYSHICSAFIYEIAHSGSRLHQFVPEIIEDAVYTRIAMDL